MLTYEAFGLAGRLVVAIILILAVRTQQEAPNALNLSVPS